MTIFFDLDGVLADFDGAAAKVLGTDDIHKFEFIYGPKKFWEALNQDSFFFRGIPVLPGARRLISTTYQHPRAILTAVPETNSEVADRQKRDWVRDNFGSAMQVITCRAADKPLFCRQDDILIDDRALNKDAWEAAGGRFIIHSDVQSTLEQLKTMGIINEDTH